MIKQDQIALLITEIATAYQPEKIYLFGSHAVGNANDNSDIDLFIIKDTDKKKVERSREVRKCIKNYPSSGIDILVFTPAEFQKGLQQTVSIGKEAITNGRLMYERV